MIGDTNLDSDLQIIIAKCRHFQAFNFKPIRINGPDTP